MPTGLGKTVVFAHLIAQRTRAGGRAMVVAHREELIFQAPQKIAAATGEKPDVAMAVHPKVIQSVVRHSVITLTMDTYGHLFPGQEYEAIGRLPAMNDGGRGSRGAGAPRHRHLRCHAYYTRKQCPAVGTLGDTVASRRGRLRPTRADKRVSGHGPRGGLDETWKHNDFGGI